MSEWVKEMVTYGGATHLKIFSREQNLTYRANFASSYARPLYHWKEEIRPTLPFVVSARWHLE